MGKYFSKFPAITYNGQVAKNLLTRANLSTKVLKSDISYYTYTLPEEQRADVVSNSYYDNPDYTWLIYLANNIIDPYHEYYLSENDFNLFVIKKYGSLRKAQTAIHSWVQNWGIDNRELIPTQYEALPGYLKKYWRGVVNNAYSEPYKYVRARNETSIKTNRIVYVNVLSTDGLNIGDEFGGTDINDLPYVGIIDAIVGKTLTLSHVIGPVAGDEYTELEGVVFDVSNIRATEVSYWMPLSVYEFEAAANAARRNVILIDKQVAFQVEKDLKKVLNQ